MMGKKVPWVHRKAFSRARAVVGLVCVINFHLFPASHAACKRCRSIRLCLQHNKLLPGKSVRCCTRLERGFRLANKKIPRTVCKFEQICKQILKPQTMAKTKSLKDSKWSGRCHRRTMTVNRQSNMGISFRMEVKGIGLNLNFIEISPSPEWFDILHV